MRVIKINDYIVCESKNVNDGYILQPGEIESNEGQVGQIMQPDGSFTDPSPTPPDPTPTLEERIDALEDAMLVII